MVLCAVLGSPASARAASGLYLQLGGGYGAWSGNELVTRELDEPGDVPLTGDGCCPSGSLALQARFGLALFNTVAPEVFAFGSGWNLDSDQAGAAFVGGGLRFYPLGMLDLVGVITELAEIPFDVSLGIGAGYAIAGSDDFGYEGVVFAVDAMAEWVPSPWFSVGLKLDVFLPSYDSFALTSRSANEGRCLDETATQIFDPSLGGRGDGVIPREQAGTLCPTNGRGPSTTVVSPQLVMTFRFDVFD
ncbi:MAG: hypothetical protein AAFZ18_34875 [Myxococcota bacterium]